MVGITDDDLLAFWVHLYDYMIFLLIWCDPIKKKQKNSAWIVYECGY